MPNDNELPDRLDAIIAALDNATNTPTTAQDDSDDDKQPTTEGDNTPDTAGEGSDASTDAKQDSKRGKQDAGAKDTQAPQPPTEQPEKLSVNRLIRERGRLRDEVTTLKARLDAAEAYNALPKELGLQASEVTTALQFMAHWKQNPVQAAQNMLAQLRAAGYNLDVGSASAIDTAAIKQMVQEAVSPFVQDRQAAQREAQLAAEVDSEINNLLDRFPAAEKHLAVLGNVLQQDPSQSLVEAYLQLENWVYKNGLDINQPLAPQLQQRRTSGTRQQATQPAPRRAAQPAATNVPVVDYAGDDVGLPLDSNNSRNVVRQVLAQHGIKV